MAVDRLRIVRGISRGMLYATTTIDTAGSGMGHSLVVRWQLTCLVGIGTGGRGPGRRHAPPGRPTPSPAAAAVPPASPAGAGGPGRGRRPGCEGQEALPALLTNTAG